MSAEDKKRPWLFISIIASLLLLAGNVVVYMMYQQRPTTPPPPVAQTQPPPEDDVAALAREQRTRGVEALRKGDYKTARVALEASKTLDPDQDDIDALLEVTGKLSEKKEAPRPPPAPKPVREVAVAPPAEEPPTAAPRRSRSRSSARRTRSSPRSTSRSTPSPAEPEDGMILVTAEAGLRVYVDGQSRDITPARITVNPGPHVVELRRGDTAVSRFDVVVNPGGVAVINDKPRPEPKQPPASEPAGLRDDPALDLVALLDRDRPADETEAARVEAPPSQDATRWAPTPTTEAPRLVVYVPGKASAVRASLADALPGIRVVVVSRSADLSPQTPADAVMAPPSAVAQAGLTTRLRSRSEGGYVLASFNSIPSRAALAEMTIAVVGELDRKAMPERVRGILGTSTAPSLRRVARAEDLLSSMQLGMADAILVRASEYPALKRRTRQELNEKTFAGGGGALVVAYVDGGRGERIAAALRALDSKTRSDLGVSEWVQ